MAPRPAARADSSAFTSRGSMGLIQRLRNERDALARRHRERGAVAERLPLEQGLDPLVVACFQELPRRMAAV